MTAILMIGMRFPQKRTGIISTRNASSQKIKHGWAGIRQIHSGWKSLKHRNRKEHEDLILFHV